MFISRLYSSVVACNLSVVVCYSSVVVFCPSVVVCYSILVVCYPSVLVCHSGVVLEQIGRSARIDQHIGIKRAKTSKEIFPRTALQQCEACLETSHNQEPLGKPNIIISRGQLEFLLSMGFNKTQLSRTLGVSTHTISRQMT